MSNKQFVTTIRFIETGVQIDIHTSSDKKWQQTFQQLGLYVCNDDVFQTSDDKLVATLESSPYLDEMIDYDLDNNI